MCELVKLLFIISVVCSKFYAINRNFTRPPVPPVPTNMMSGKNWQVYVMFVSCNPRPDAMRDRSHSVLLSNRIELNIAVWPELQINMFKEFHSCKAAILWPWDWIGLAGEVNCWAHPSLQDSPGTFVNFASGVTRVANLMHVGTEGSLGWNQPCPLHGTLALDPSWWVQLPFHPHQVRLCWGAVRRECVHLRLSSIDAAVLSFIIRKL